MTDEYTYIDNRFDDPDQKYNITEETLLKLLNEAQRESCGANENILFVTHEAVSGRKFQMPLHALLHATISFIEDIYVPMRKGEDAK